jgi:hypothetical protein
MSEKLPWRMPTVKQMYDAFSEPQAWDDTRFWIEQELLQKYVHRVGADDLEEAVHHWVVDLLDMGHYPSRHMLRMISGELQRFWFPYRGSHSKQRQRIREYALLWHDRSLQDYLARTKYGNRRGAQTKAKQDVAEMHGLTLPGLHQRHVRYRARVNESTDALWRRRSRYPKSR